MAQLALSLRGSLKEAKAQTDCRFLFGTEVSSNYKTPPHEAYEVWKPLPVSHLQNQTTEIGKHLISQSAIFPRLASSLEEAKAKLVPKLTEFVKACKDWDVSGEEGLLNDEEVTAAMKDTGVFLSSADTGVLLANAPRAPSGLVRYQEFSSLLLDNTLPASSLMTPSGICAGRPTLPTSFAWPSDQQGFEVVLRLRPDSSPFIMSAGLMDKYARKATELRRLEHDAEKVHAMLRHAMVMDLVVEAGRPGFPGLDFRQWLADNGVLSLTTRKQPGPIVPEVYDCLDQVIYEGLDFPRVVPATQVLTSFQSSMRGSLKLPPNMTAESTQQGCGVDA